MENAKEFFQQILNIDRQIDSKFEQLERLKSLATKVTSVMRETAAKPSNVSRSTENSVEKIILLQNELNAEIDQYVDMKQTAYGILKEMKNEKQRRCLEYRYLLGKSFEAIAEEMGYSYFGICKLHSRALQSADEIFIKIREVDRS